MSIKKEFYNPEYETTAIYEEVWQPELLTVKDEENLLVMSHYWQDSDGELWGDFENPMENVKRAFNEYRKRKGYMLPNQIRNLRNELGFSVREFADKIGIAPSSLTQIENNQRVQTKYQDLIFQLIADKKGEKKQTLKNFSKPNAS